MAVFKDSFTDQSNGSCQKPSKASLQHGFPYLHRSIKDQQKSHPEAVHHSFANTTITRTRNRQTAVLAEGPRGTFNKTLLKITCLQRDNGRYLGTGRCRLLEVRMASCCDCSKSTWSTEPHTPTASAPAPWYHVELNALIARCI